MSFLLFCLVLYSSVDKFTAAASTCQCIEEHCISTTKPLPNYYWRNYQGTVPRDAVPGGHTSAGKVTYIGQTLLLGIYNVSGIIPGVILPGTNEVEAPYGHYRGVKYNAILCSDTPEGFKWKQVKQNELHLLTDYLVVGGYEYDQTAYIGRISYGNNLIIGKVFNERSIGMQVLRPGGKEFHYDTFEILLYKQ